ncbi:uncharacterized protein LOC143443642 isoform X1 [Arvicanthis niloticus]|uniref:uncharacterized protein LOC143443642 isoform X1 n=1 Tax=Arvicanthis niloticus TaxID=61156 RepID=UPI00403D0AAF
MFLLTPENFPLECALERRRRRRQLWRGGKGERALFHLPGGGARIGADPEGAGRRGSHPAAGSRLRAGRSPHPRSRRIRLFSDKERGNDALRLEGRLLFRKLRPEWAASPARHSSSSRFALPKFAALAQILGFADSGLERRGVLACLLPCLSRSGVHSCCELNLQKFCTRLNKIKSFLAAKSSFAPSLYEESKNQS